MADDMATRQSLLSKGRVSTPLVQYFLLWRCSILLSMNCATGIKAHDKCYKTIPCPDERCKAKGNKTKGTEKGSMPSSRDGPERGHRVSDRGNKAKEWPRLPREEASSLHVRARSGPGMEVKPGLTRRVRPGLGNRRRAEPLRVIMARAGVLSAPADGSLRSRQD